MVWYANAEGRYGEAGRKGDTGEMVVERYLKEKEIPYDKKVDPHSQVIKKIDFIVEGVSMDVKTNIFKEFLAVEAFDNKGNKGWIYTTTAKHIYAVGLEHNSIYRYNVEDMRAHLARNQHKLKRAKNEAYLLWVPISTSFIEKLQ